MGIAALTSGTKEKVQNFPIFKISKDWATLQQIRKPSAFREINALFIRQRTPQHISEESCMHLQH